MKAIYALLNETYYQVFPTFQESLEKHQTHGREDLTKRMYEEGKILLVNEVGGYCFEKIDNLKDVHINNNFPILQNRLNYLMGANSKSKKTNKQLEVAL